MYKLDVSPKITKEFLLSKNTQETYFEHYLGIPVKKGLFCSPSIIRIDHKPTCSFYKNKSGILKYNDFAGPQFDFVGCVMYIYKCTYYKALQIIANDFGFIHIKNVEIHPPKIKYSGYEMKETSRAKIQVEIKDFSEKELNWWKSFGIGLSTLRKFKVYSIKSVFLNGVYYTSSTEYCPIYGYYGGTNSNKDELWRLYFPTKRNYRFLSNWNSLMIQGAKQIPKSGDSALITKSLKDVMCLFEFGTTAIAPNSENILLSKAQYEKLSLRFKEIICLFDNDLPGVKGAHKYKKEFGIRCIFIKRKYSKDITDLYKTISETQFWIAIDELNEIINNKEVRETKHFYIF